MRTEIGAVLSLWLAALVGVSSLHGATILNYQGRVSVAGKPFTGSGHFSFVLVDGSGDTLWASSPFPLQRTTNLPPGVLTLPVTNGLYAVRLGDTNAGMPPIDGSVIVNAVAPKLRVWFNDGVNGWQVAGDEVSLGIAHSAGVERRETALDGTAVTAILREIRQLKTSMDRPRPANPAPPAQHIEQLAQVTVPIGDGPGMGQADAPLVLVEFTDYQCTYCKRFNDTILPELIKNYVNTGKLRIVSRNLILPFHQQAEPAALAALCAHKQDKFWAMRQALFTNTATLSVTNFITAAQTLGLDLPDFRACLDQKTFAEQIKTDGADAKSAGITGTPTFVLGKPSGGKVAGVLIVGARPFAIFENEIKRLLAEVALAQPAKPKS